MQLIHGSSVPHKIGSILKAKKRPTEWSYRKFAGINIETFLEKNRPKGEISRLESIFMVDRVKCLNLAGASEDYIYLVETKDHVTKAHFGWVTRLINFLYDVEDPIPGTTPLSKSVLRRELIQAAGNYWAGVPCDKKCKLDVGPSAWEYLTKEVRIVRRIH